MSTEATARKSQRTRQAVVLTNKMDKTAVVEVTRRVRHPKYKKFVKQRIRYSAHDADNTCNVGDQVVIEETRPLSKTKRWRVKEVVKRAANV